MENFKELNLPQELFHRLEQMEFLKPTGIQAEAIPVAMEGKDVLGTAQTGTGKTGAYGIPLIAQLLNSPRGTGLILLPTRELAAQVLKELKKFIGKSKINTALLIGGESMPQQMKQLRMQPRLIVGTPGRINDHLDRGSLMLHQVNYLVLDEVDRMLDMGFGIQLDAIAKFITNKHQTLMFSATLPDSIQRISKKYLTDPVRITVGSTNATAPKIKQESVRILDADKYGRLLSELDERTGTVILFIKTKHGADKMAMKLRKDGHKAEALHGDLRQNKRNKIVRDYRDQKFRILIGTDVAARGLDIPHIEHVINYDLPQCAEDYIHRIGRTARNDAEGSALNFISPSDGAKWKAIQRLLDPNGDHGEERDYKPKKNRNRRIRDKQNERSGPRSGRRPQGGGQGGGYKGKSDGRSDERSERRDGGRSEERSGGYKGKSAGRSEERSERRSGGRSEERSNDNRNSNGNRDRNRRSEESKTGEVKPFKKRNGGKPQGKPSGKPNGRRPQGGGQGGGYKGKSDDRKNRNAA